MWVISKQKVLDEIVLEKIPFTCTKNNKGPKILPCGTPDFTGRTLNKQESKETLWSLSVRLLKESKHESKTVRLLNNSKVADNSKVTERVHNIQHTSPIAYQLHLTSNWLLSLAASATLDRKRRSLCKQDLLIRNPNWYSDSWGWTKSIILSYNDPLQHFTCDTQKRYGL